MKLIDNNIFLGLLYNLKIDEENSNLEQVVVKSKYKNFELDFYMDYDSSGCREYDTLIQNELGTMVFGEWHELTTNSYQDKLLFDYYSKLEEPFLKELERKASLYDGDNDFNGDNYEYFGVKREMFV